MSRIIVLGVMNRWSAIFAYVQPCFLKAIAISSLLHLHPLTVPRWRDTGGDEIVKT